MSAESRPCRAAAVAPRPREQQQRRRRGRGRGRDGRRGSRTPCIVILARRLLAASPSAAATFLLAACGSPLLEAAASGQSIQPNATASMRQGLRGPLTATSASGDAASTDYLAEYFQPDEDGFTVFDYDSVGLDSRVRALALQHSHHLRGGDQAAPRSESQDVRATLVPRVIAAKQFSHFAEVHQTCATFPFCNHIPPPPPLLPNPADFVVRNTIAQLEHTPGASRLPAAYWNPHKLPMQQQRADQSAADLGVMAKARDLKLPPQLRGDPARWLPPPAQFPLYRHAIGNIKWDVATDANSANILPTPKDLVTGRLALETLGDLGPVPQDVHQPINVDVHTDDMYNNGPVPQTDIDGPIGTMSLPPGTPRKISPDSQAFARTYEKYLKAPPAMPSI